jgi:hypothetical protein
MYVSQRQILRWKVPESRVCMHHEIPAGSSWAAMKFPQLKKGSRKGCRDTAASQLRISCELLGNKNEIQGQERCEECKQTRERGGTIERVRHYRQLLGIPTVGRSHFQHPSMISRIGLLGLHCPRHFFSLLLSPPNVPLANKPSGKIDSCELLGP